MASQSGKSRSNTGRSSSSRSGSAQKKKTAVSGSTAKKSTSKSTSKTTSKSSSARSSSASRSSSGSRSRSTPAKSAPADSRSAARSGTATLAVIAAIVVLLFAMGVNKGQIDVMSEDPMAQFTDFLLGEDQSGGETAAPESDPEDGEPVITPAVSKSETTTTTAGTTAASTSAAPETTTAAQASTTTQTTTTAKTTTARTAATTGTTAAKTTTTPAEAATTVRITTTKNTTAKTQATEPTRISIETTAVTATTAPTYANAAYVVDPDYESPYYIVVFAGKSQSVAIYTKDAGGKYSVLARCFTCSTGAPESPTRTGQYKIRAKYRWRLLQGDVYGQYSSSISSSYLFHSVPYLKESESSLDMAEYDKLGTQASHGCIRLCVRDTKWIYDNCPIGTQVNIVNKSGPSGGGVPSLKYDAKYRGWDPTDPDSDNPYN